MSPRTKAAGVIRREESLVFGILETIMRQRGIMIGKLGQINLRWGSGVGSGGWEDWRLPDAGRGT